MSDIPNYCETIYEWFFTRPNIKLLLHELMNKTLHDNMLLSCALYHYVAFFSQRKNIMIGTSKLFINFYECLYNMSGDNTPEHNIIIHSSTFKNYANNIYYNHARISMHCEIECNDIWNVDRMTIKKCKIPYNVKIIKLFLTKENMINFLFHLFKLCIQQYPRCQCILHAFILWFIEQHDINFKCMRNVSFFDLFFDFITSRFTNGIVACDINDIFAHCKNKIEMLHECFYESNFLIYKKYYNNFPPTKIRLCAIMEQIQHNEEHFCHNSPSIILANSYIMKCILNMMDISN